MHVLRTTRRRLGAVLVAALAATTLLHAPAAGAATQRWVDPAAAASGPGTGCGSDAGYATIQAAITASASGDTVQVCPGTYAGPITINKADLTLLGAKAGVPAGPDADPAGRGTGESVIEAAGVNAVNWSGAASVNTTIDGFTIRNADRHGIALATSGHTIVNNVLEYSGTVPAANAQQSGIIGGRSDGHTFASNSVIGFRYGFNLQSGNPADRPTLIEGNYVDFVFTGVIFGTNTADGHTVRGNTVIGRPGAGGQAINTPSRLMEISDNTLRGPAATGIYLPGTAPSSGTQITGNTIGGFTWGIYQGTPHAQLPADSPPNEVHGNNIAGNSAWGVFNQAAPGVLDVDAVCNWWGAAEGPRTGPTGPGDRVSPGVDYTPWLTAPAPEGSCVGGLPAPSAEFSADPESGAAPLVVAFDASASSAPNGRTIVSYDWDFGDGATGSGVTTSHTYTAPGEYLVTLTVTDDLELTDEATTTITVSANQPATDADCKRGGWESYGFANQGQCVRFVSTGKDSRAGQ